MVICTEAEAFERGFKRYLHQRKFGLVYILPCSVGKRKLCAVCTESEASKYGLNVRKAGLVFGDLPRDRESWEENHSNPVLLRAKRLSRYVKAMKTVAKLEGRV